MKTNFKRILSLSLAMILAFSSLAITVSADTFTWDNVPENAVYPSKTDEEKWSADYLNGKFYKNMQRIPLTGDGARDAVAVALSQVGYLEGDYASEEDGESGGSYNYTEYGAYTNVNGGTYSAWCASFCSWVLYTSKANTKRSYVPNPDGSETDGDSVNMARNGWCWGETYVPYWSTMLYNLANGSYRFSDAYLSWDYYGHPSYQPQPGNLVFFISNAAVDKPLDEGHVGLVVYSDDTYVYTIEGNTSSQDGVEAEGGGVFFKKYALGGSNIAGYGILPYETVSDLPELDYSGANPTPGLYVTASGATGVYSDPNSDSNDWTLPYSSVFEVTDIQQSTSGRIMLKSKCEINGETVYGWVPLGTATNGYARTLQIYATPNGMPDHSDKLQFSNASLTITDDIAVNFKASKTKLDGDAYTNPYVVFEMNGEETTVTDYTVVGGEYVFDLPNIAPHQMNDTITATLYATKDEEVCLGETIDYSIKEYCYNTLANYSDNEKLRTLIVDLLNYGAKSQEYMSYKTATYVNADLTSTQKAWGTASDRTLTSVLDVNYATVANPSVTWKGAGLNLKESVGMRFRFEADSLEGLTVKITSGSDEWTLGSESFETNVYGNYVFFEGLDVDQMSDEVYVTAYKNGTAVSNTLRYSIESYAYAKLDSSDSVLVELVKAMMRYGDSAKAYNLANAQ